MVSKICLCFWKMRLFLCSLELAEGPNYCGTSFWASFMDSSDSPIFAA